MKEPTHEDLKNLAKALQKAATLSQKHMDAVHAAESAFEKAFGEDVPNEMGVCSGAFATNFEEVGSLFNDFTNHNENMAGKTAMTLARCMAALMKEGDDEDEGDDDD